MNKKTEITVADQSVRLVEYRGQRVVTLGMVDQVHGRPDGTARRNFNENRDRLIEGEDFMKVSANEFRTRNPGAISNRVTEDVTVLTESGYLMLVKSFTDDLAWHVQRQLVRNYFRKEDQAQKVDAGNTKRQLSRNQVAASILLLRSAAEDLQLAPSAILGGYQRLEAKLGVPGLLPAYAVDAPKGSTTGSSEAALSATELLKRHGVDMSSISFNRLLLNAGFLEEKTRPSSKGGEKSFKSVTDFEYGKNETSPSNPRETQPLWYPSKFAELLEFVLPKKPEAVA